MAAPTPNLDLGAFIDLCHEHGLWFLARPGPFIMAEMKNEGLPYRLYTEHPEIVPVTWDGKPVSSRTVDYLAPAFLAESRKWYEAVMPVLATRLEPDWRQCHRGATRQRDRDALLGNELTRPDREAHFADLGDWLRRQYAGEEMCQHATRSLGMIPRHGWRQCARPRRDFAPALHHDLGRYMRNRFARYVAALRDMPKSSA